MIDFGYLERGIAGLARAHHGGGMAGHLGSAVIAGYFFGEMRADAETGVHLGVERDLERIINGEEAFWIRSQAPTISVPEMFAPLTGLKPPPNPVKSEAKGVAAIAEALLRNIDKTRQSGHNVIFASIAIRALHDHPEYATPAVIDGMVRLVSSFDGGHGGRGYYGKKAGWKSGNEVKLDEGGGATPAYDSLEGMAVATFDELIATADEHRQGFGGLFHLIDHAAALAEIATAGFPKLAEKGIPAHGQHLALIRSLPVVDDELGKLVKSELDPMTAEYWHTRKSVQWEGWLTHRIKCLYGFAVLARLVEDPAKRQQAEAAFRYLMA